MRQTNKEDRFSSNKPNRRERAKNGRSVCLINTRLFFLSLCLPLLIAISSFYFCLSICVLYTEGKQFQRISTKKQICYTFLSFLLWMLLPLSMQKSIEETHSYIDIYVYRRQIIFSEKRKKIWNNNIPPQNLTYTRLHKYIFLIHYEKERVIKENNRGTERRKSIL
jgi:hypothetical protein